MTDTPETDETEYIAMHTKLERERDSLRELVDRMGAMIFEWRAGYGGQVASEFCDCGDCEDILKLDAVIAAWKKSFSGSNPSAPCSPSFECCGYAHPWSDKKCNREKGHGGEHACIEHYSGRQNEWWKGKDNE